jgi:carboxypeptidase PM20D1
VVADERVQIAKLPRMITEPRPPSPLDSPGYRRVSTVIRQFFPDAVITPILVLGATDGRHYAPVADGVYGFVPSVGREDDLPRMHGTNERVGVEMLATMARAYAELISSP